MQTNEIIPTDSEDRKERALSLITAIRHNVFNAIYQMQQMRNEELFKELGYNSLIECFEAELNLKPRTFYNYQKVLDRFLPDALNTNQCNTLHFPSVSIVKLLELSRLPQQQTSRLLTEGKINIRGKEYSIEKINQTPRNELKRIMANKSKEQIKVAEQKQIKKEFAAEYSTLEKTISKLLTVVFASEFITEFDQADIQVHMQECIRIIDQYLTIYKK